MRENIAFLLVTNRRKKLSFNIYVYEGHSIQFEAVFTLYHSFIQIAGLYELTM